MAEPAENKVAPGGFAPLKIPVFAVLWGATVLGNVGSFMRDVASSWLVTDLSSNPSAVALMQTAATLPVFLLAIPAGVLSDILDRRRFLIFVQILLASVSGTLLLLSQSGALTVEYLLALTFIGGIGGALMGPTWQSIVPELVPRADLRNAVALNSLGINIARAIGPAAGGLLLASFGAGAAYGADVLSYVFVVAALLWWRRPKVEDNGLSEHFFGAFRAGIRYARASRELHVVLLRAAVFFVFSSSVWALLPLVARRYRRFLRHPAGCGGGRRDRRCGVITPAASTVERRWSGAVGRGDHRSGNGVAVVGAATVAGDLAAAGTGWRLDYCADLPERRSTGRVAKLGAWTRAGDLSDGV